MKCPILSLTLLALIWSCAYAQDQRVVYTLYSNENNVTYYFDGSMPESYHSKAKTGKKPIVPGYGNWTPVGRWPYDVSVADYPRYANWVQADPWEPNSSFFWRGVTVWAVNFNLDCDVVDPTITVKYRVDNYMQSIYLDEHNFKRGITRPGIDHDVRSPNGLLKTMDFGGGVWSDTTYADGPGEIATANLADPANPIQEEIHGKLERRVLADGATHVVLLKGNHWLYVRTWNYADASGVVFMMTILGKPISTGTFDSLTPSSVNTGARNITAAGTIKDLPSDGKVRMTYKPASGGMETPYSTVATVTGETWTLPMSFNLPAAGTYTFRAYAADSSGTSLAELGTKSLAVTATPSKLSVSARTKPKPGLEMWLKASPTTTRVFTLP